MLNRKTDKPTFPLSVQNTCATSYTLHRQNVYLSELHNHSWKETLTATLTHWTNYNMHVMHVQYLIMTPKLSFMIFIKKKKPKMFQTNNHFHLIKPHFKHILTITKYCIEIELWCILYNAETVFICTHIQIIVKILYAYCPLKE